jgi:phytoene dehydrogenase-like protein
MRHSYADFLDSLFDDPKLKAVLTAPCGNWALPASKVGALYPLANFSYYANGAFFPRGGSGALRDALMARAKSYGVQYRCNAEATRIHVKDHHVESVGLNTGERIRCDAVLSDVNPIITLGQMLKGTELSNRLKRKITEVVPSLSVFWLFLGMNRDLRTHGMGAWNIWDYASWDVEAAFEPVFKDQIQTDGMLFVSPNSLKDDTHTVAPQGKSTLEAIIWAPYEQFAKWEGIAPQERGPEYERLTVDIGDSIIAELDKRLPGVVGDVEVKECATPVDANYRVRALRGGIYGPAFLPGSTPPRRFSTRTPVRNLYLVGAGVFGGSIGGCIVSGKHAAKIALSDQ